MRVSGLLVLVVVASSADWRGWAVLLAWRWIAGVGDGLVLSYAGSGTLRRNVGPCICCVLLVLAGSED